MKYSVLLYYKYIDIADPEAERLAMRALCEELELKGRILIGYEGLNGTVAGLAENIEKYKEAMAAHPLFNDIEYKQDMEESLPFEKLKIKVRPEVVTLGADVDLSNTAPRLTPEQFDEMIKDPNVVLFDARNNYESAIGKFKGAVTPDIKLFKDLPEALKDYEDLKDKTVVTYCTGGIRCEKASALMRQEGFKDVYQLDGGIIKYAKQFPDGAFEGACFVFDERMSVDFKDDTALVGTCHFCKANTNTYRNCANPLCNDLILVCDDHLATNDRPRCIDCQALVTTS